MIERIKNNPVLVTALVQYLLTLGVVFGWDLTSEQQAAIIAVTGGILALFARQLVTPVRMLEREAE